MPPGADYRCTGEPVPRHRRATWSTRASNTAGASRVLAVDQEKGGGRPAVNSPSRTARKAATLARQAGETASTGRRGRPSATAPTAGPDCWTGA